MAKSSLVEAIQQACDVARSAKKMQWQSNVIQADYDHLDRNLDALVQELAKGCFRIFNQAAGAISRSVSVSFHPRAHQSPADNTPSVHIEHTALRKHVAIADKEWIQSLAIRTQLKRSLLCIVKVQVTGGEFAELPRVNVALLDCFATEDSDSNIEILEAEFFDDESIVVVYRLPSRDVTLIGGISSGRLVNT
ncbi:hypothetical protein AX16_009510 [Volvariella volvacea WC 439]|nr:hypothetical protein AX16_009510 [Volvariella volvacea WC 439]